VTDPSIVTTATPSRVAFNDLDGIQLDAGTAHLHCDRHSQGEWAPYV
jgi:hypothetical protein